MAQIFISYSRVDIKFVEQLYKRLQQSFPEFIIWLDQGHHGLLGGDSWWDEIMKAVAASDIFIYVLSNESVQSPYCQAEFREAQRLQKRIITIQARDRTNLSEALSDIQYIDMKNGVDDADALVRLNASVRRQLGLVKKNVRPLWKGITTKPKDAEEAKPILREDVTTPKLEAVHAASPVKPSSFGGNWVLAVSVVFVIIALAVGSMFFSNFGTRLNNTPEPTTETAQTPEETNEVAQAPSDSSSLTPSSSATNLPIELIVGTLDSQATADQATAYHLQTVSARGTAYALSTQNVIELTATATFWTHTPTPNVTASIDAFRTGQAAIATNTAEVFLNLSATAEAVTAQYISSSTSAANTQIAATTTQAAIATNTAEVFLNLSATAEAVTAQYISSSTAAANTQIAAVTTTQVFIDSWTAIPTYTLTPTPTATLTPTFTPTLTGRELAYQLAEIGVNTNTEWLNLYSDGYIEYFNAVPMVLVPAGCFEMGNDPAAYTYLSTSSEIGVPTGGQQCFTEPFWIDLTEVTQSDFDRLGETMMNNSAFIGENHPVDTADFYTARAFCEEQRNARLPTEAEWEYAARGVDSWFYPWGNSLIETNAIWNFDFDAGHSEVGTILQGRSWIGAFDMSGNVWEWTNSIFDSYPYDKNDGREAGRGNTSNTFYVMRGGGFGNLYSYDLRSATRSETTPTDANPIMGFRCAMDYNAMQPD